MIRSFLAAASACFLLASWTPVPQTINPDCTGVGLWGGGPAIVLECVNTGCAQACVVETIDTAWGKGTGGVCRCDYIGPPPNCCRLVILGVGGGGFAVTGECNFPSCNDAGDCILNAAAGPPPLVAHFFADCVEEGTERPFPGDYWFNPNDSSDDGSSDGGSDGE